MNINIDNNNYIPYVNNKSNYYGIEFRKLPTMINLIDANQNGAYNYNFYENNEFKYIIFNDLKVFCHEKWQDNEIICIYSIDIDLFTNETKETRKDLI